MNQIDAMASRAEWITIAQELNWGIELLKNDPTDIKTWQILFATQEAFKRLQRGLPNKI